MKNFIEYYYNFVNITVHNKKDYYYFYYNNSTYIFTKTKRNVQELVLIYKLLDNNKKYNKIVLNRNKSPITNYKNENYILIRFMYKYEEIDLSDLNKNQITLTKEYNILLRNNWTYLLSEKIDYIEYQIMHLDNKYKILHETVDYYIGMAENSISYINNTIREEKPNVLDNLVISHKRINKLDKNSFYNPTDVVIDHPSRDISEYLKAIFINKTYDIDTLKNIFNKINMSIYGYRLLYGRMLYPSFYFDFYERIINKKEPIENIYKIIERVGEYENYLYTIYNLINTKIKIPKIDWI